MELRRAAAVAAVERPEKQVAEPEWEFPEWLGARPSASADVPRPGPAVVNYDIHPVDLELVPILSMHAARKQRDRRREQEREREEEEPKDEL
jgi:hypothetical protein